MEPNQGPRRFSRRSFVGTTAAGTAAVAAAVATPGVAQASSDSGGGKSAATIRYRPATRPDWVPDDFVAPPGVRQRFFAIQAIDGFQVDAVLFEPLGRSPADTTLILRVHGSNGTYVGFEMPRLSAEGYAVLSINTRQSSRAPHLEEGMRGGETDNFLDIRKDIEAAFYTAVDLGYEKIVLNGRSLGNIQVQFYAATNWDNRIRAVILPAMFAKLPWKSRHILTNDEENYQQLFDEAVDLLAQGRQDEVLPTEMQGGGGNPNRTGPVTAQHFLTYRREHSSTADGTYWIKKVPRPILMLRGDQDAVIRDFEPNWLVAAATSEGSIVPSIKFVEIPGAGHGLNENPDAVIDAEVSWLQELGL